MIQPVRRSRHAPTAIIILGVFLVLEFGTSWAVRLALPELAGWGRWALMNGLQLTGCLLATMALYRASPASALRQLGLVASIPRAAAFGLAVTIPMPLLFAATGPLASGVDPRDLLLGAGLSPLAEEVLFRGFAFWLLYRLAGWGFWAAALVPAAIFGFGHFSQGQDLGSAAGILVITAVGSVWWSWLLMRWENLWIPVFLHMLMNGWWAIFQVDETALGGALANLARVLVIALSIAATWRLRKDGPVTLRRRVLPSTD